MMKGNRWFRYLFWILAFELIGACSGLLIADDIRIWRVMAIPAPLTPPDYVFPVVWGILYGLMGISLARVRMEPESTLRAKAVRVFTVQLFLNFFWGLIFFSTQAYGFALIWLIAMVLYIVSMIRAFLKLDRAAGLLQVPYLIWSLLATYLNAAVWFLN